MNNPNFDAIDVAWFSGLFEGDGSLGRGGREKQRTYLTIQMTDKDVLQKCKDKFGGSNVTGPYAKNNGKGYNIKPMYSWSLQIQEEVWLLVELMKPHLGSRRLQQIAEAELRRDNSNLVSNTKKTHCPQGHEYTPENTQRRNNKRYCKPCNTKYSSYAYKMRNEGGGAQ